MAKTSRAAVAATTIAFGGLMLAACNDSADAPAEDAGNTVTDTIVTEAPEEPINDGSEMDGMGNDSVNGANTNDGMNDMDDAVSGGSDNVSPGASDAEDSMAN
ncbi:hypothetical protein [Corynebacterium yudongzhengii]|uniref:hypothetical protein n=1 Tax=Corynebacterium yudongzhengii TaxID=2080740 RepID=UPI0011B1FC88|nr:hypothetical protein [Corynebacterium yudongzhengii]